MLRHNFLKSPACKFSDLKILVCKEDMERYGMEKGWILTRAQASHLFRQYAAWLNIGIAPPEFLGVWDGEGEVPEPPTPERCTPPPWPPVEQKRGSYGIWRPKGTDR